MKSSAKKRRKGERTFDPATLRRAHRMVVRYRLIVEPEPDGGYLGRLTELPGVMADGSTQIECLRSLLFAAETMVASMLEDGLTPPEPANAARRREQINIRLTSEERALLAGASERRGYKGVSEFVRSAALRECLREKP